MNPACSEIAIGINAGTAARQDVGVGQQLGGLPPAEPAVGHEVEERDERELERHEEIAAERAAQHRGRRAPLRATRRATAADEAGNARRARLSAAMNTSA